MLSSKLRKGLQPSFRMGLWKYALKMKYHYAQPHFILLALSQPLGNSNLCWSNSCVLSYSSQFRVFNWSRLLPTFILTDLQLLCFNIFSQLEEKRSQFFSSALIIVFQETQSAVLHFTIVLHLTIETAFFIILNLFIIIQYFLIFLFLWIL